MSDRPQLYFNALDSDGIVAGIGTRPHHDLTRAEGFGWWTPQLIVIAREHIERTTDPHDDLTIACGEWLKANPIPVAFYTILEGAVDAEGGKSELVLLIRNAMKPGLDLELTDDNVTNIMIRALQRVRDLLASDGSDAAILYSVRETFNQIWEGR